MQHEAQTRGVSPGGQRRPARVPGGWPAALIAALTALLVGSWARQAHDASRSGINADASSLAGVSPGEFLAALDTIGGSPRQLARLRDRDACSRRLAWVTIMRAPGETPGRIRLRSGNYVSPLFDLLDKPVRVALPYPAPYETGRGVIFVMGATSAATVALTPPWHVPAQGGVEARTVIWTPVGTCPKAHQ